MPKGRMGYVSVHPHAPKICQEACMQYVMLLHCSARWQKACLIEFLRL